MRRLCLGLGRGCFPPAERAERTGRARQASSAAPQMDAIAGGAVEMLSTCSTSVGDGGGGGRGGGACQGQRGIAWRVEQSKVHRNLQGISVLAAAAKSCGTQTHADTAPLHDITYATWTWTCTCTFGRHAA